MGNLTMWDSELLRKCDTIFTRHFTPGATLINGYGTETKGVIKIADEYASSIYEMILQHQFDVPAGELEQKRELFACRAYYCLKSSGVRLPLATASSFLAIWNLLKKSEAALLEVCKMFVLSLSAAQLDFPDFLGVPLHTHMRRNACVYV